ncbi:MAG: transketolase, partial [Candidatus Colwellbacteria bacterium RBG_13_48_8]
MYLSDKDLKFLGEQAAKVRKKIIEMLLEAGSGHSAGSLGMADIFTALYFHILEHDPKNPYWPERDRLVVSNGHVVPAQYAAMAYAGYFPLKELKTLRKINSRLQGQPHRCSLPGIEVSSGPLGLGLGQAAGMALAARLDRKKYRIYCLMSDAEQQEGGTWEAAMFIGKNKLTNLTAIMDRNGIQISGYTEDIMPLEPLREKYEAFGWHVLEIDGHNFEQIIDAVNESKAVHYKPTLIIAH